MSSDDQQQILGDFLTWIRQNESAGMEWFLDDGSGTAPAEETQEAKTDDPFLEICTQFVAQTIPLIEGQPARPADKGSAADKAAALTALREEVLPCTSCPLHEGRKSTVFGAGSPEAEVVFIGEAPGRDEDIQGEPFVGRSGQLLTKILGAIGYERDDVFICNILKCRPPNNRDPQADEVAACEPHLKRQLEILNPRVICCLGRVAAQTLLGTDASLKRLRETVHFYEGIPVMATYHPAALLRNPSWKRETWNDVRKMRALVEALNQRES
ncbi:MAG: uracil-DNA glycosylase [Candidatus Krumholzibacteriota bacterium]